jgi:antitoxin CptB
MTDNDTLTRRKRLYYRSANRGWKETDLLVGRFAEQHLPQMSLSELDDFEALLDESDPDIFGWITGKQEIPEKFNTPVMEKLRSFKLVR